MNQISKIAKKTFIGLAIAVQVFGYSTFSFSRIALADETTAATSAAAVPPACPDVTGTKAPTGAGSHTFVFNEATCLWENNYYTWSPVTKQYTPKYSQARTYNPTANSWEHPNWVFVSSDGQYVLRTVSTPATVAEQIAMGDAPPVSQTQADTSQPATNSSSITSGNGTDSDNNLSNTNNIDVNGNYINNASVFTTLDSNATSGNASALQNTTVGNVGTGDALAMANILNMIQSSWNPAYGDLTLFNANLFNNYTGDLLFDPSIALGNGTGSNNVIDSENDLDLTLNVEDNADIENDINLNATSGNATANTNTTVGDVSTGDATAIANVINMINSMITSGQSFIGNLNLHGDLNGDILLPQSLLDILLGNGTGSTNTIDSDNDADIDITSANNSTITNNTTLGATSGDANANNNTTVGNLTTGNSDTNVNEMNLVGQNVQGTKGLLVFVNVMGSWVGMLFGNPGSTSIVGGNGSQSTNNITSDNDLDADINSERNYSITNNLNLDATSGNATANGNTTVGNVSTGNATSSVNLLNMIDSNINFTDWFGVLFINVFGNWNGSFGVDTAAGEVTGGMGGGSSQAQANAASSQTNRTSTPAANRFLNFVATASASAETTTTTDTPKVLAAEEEPKEAKKPVVANTTGASRANFWFAVGGIGVALGLLGLERALTFRRR